MAARRLSVLAFNLTNQLLANSSDDINPFEMLGGGVPTLNNVLQAIDALYVNPENSVKESASKWLCEFQKSLYAWEIADQLLYLERDLSSSYFGAQTMRIKIQIYFTELPTNAQSALKNSLLNHVRKLTSDTHSSIANQLCLAVADLFCQMVQWDDGISDIVKALSTSEVTSIYLIDVLKFISEEMNSKALRLGLNRRRALQAHLESQKGLVLDFLSYKVKDADPQTLARIFSCLASWWDYTGIMKDRDVRVSPLLEGAFYILQHPENYPEPTYNASMEWILALLFCCPTVSGYRGELLTLLQTNIYSLYTVLQQCSLQASKAAENSMIDCSVYVDRVSSIAQIFGSLARTVRSALVSKPTPPGSGEPGDLRTLDCVLAVLESPAPTGCRATALHTFYALQSLADDAAWRHNSLGTSPGRQSPSVSSVGDTISSASRPVTALLIPYFTRVVVALTRYCPSNTEDLESAEDLRSFREEAHSLMQDIVDLVGADTIFIELYNHISRLQEMDKAGTAINVFREAEACLFMLTTVAKRLSPHDPEGRIASLVSTLVLPGLAAMPPPPLQEVGCILYAELSHWVACHPDIRRQIVEQLIQITERAAGVSAAQLQPGQKQAVSAAISALGRLCSVHRFHPVAVINASSNGGIAATTLLEEHWKDIAFRVVNSLPRLAWAPVQGVIDFFEGICRGLMASIAYSPQDSFPTDPRPARAILPERLAQLVSVSVQCISKLIEQNQPIEFVDALSDPCVWLDYLATIFRSLQNFLPRLDDAYRRSRLSSISTDEVQQQRQAEVNSLANSAQACLDGCLRVVTDMVWPVIGQVLEHYSTKMRPMERCCRVIRFMVRSFSVNLRDILPDIANKLVQAFQRKNHSCFLYLAGVLVDVFGDLPDCRPGLVGLFEALAPPTLASLSFNLAEQPHTIEDFYRLCVRLVQHCAGTFLASPNVDLYTLLDTALKSLDLLTLAAAGSGHTDLSTSQNVGNGNGTGDAKDTAFASNAAARFLLEVLIFTTDASEDSPTTVVAATDVNLLPQPTCEGSLGARRLLFWLLKPAQMCGGQRLTTSCIHSCCMGLPDDRFPEMADLLYRLKIVMPREIFGRWIDCALANLPATRADGLVQATAEQVAEFKNSIMNASRSSGITHALDAFVVLFR